MEEVPVRYERHIFVCVNEREQGDSCGKRGSDEILRLLRDHINLNGLVGKYNVTKTRCLGHCAFGPTIAIYPDGKIMRKVTIQDTKKIIKEYLV